MLTGLVSCGAAPEQEAPITPNPTNIIYFVGDGMGYNHVLAANYFEHGEAGAQVYEQDDWYHVAQATYMAARVDGEGDTIYMNGYAPRTAWENADYLSRDYTDSGAAGTALSTAGKLLVEPLALACMAIP